MKFSFLTILMTLGLLNSVAAFGHGDKAHSHKPIDEAKAKELAVAAVEGLVSEGKVESEWKGLAPSLQKKRFGMNIEWVATFENTKAKDTAKKNLYVFLSLTGEFIAANHTGK